MALKIYTTSAADLRGTAAAAAAPAATRRTDRTAVTAQDEYTSI